MSPLTKSLKAHIIVNRILYAALGASLLLSAILILKYPKFGASLLLVATPLMYLDSGGSYFNLLSSMLQVADENPSFDYFYNDLRIPTHPWELSFLIAGVVVGFRSLVLVEKNI